MSSRARRTGRIHSARYAARGSRGLKGPCGAVPSLCRRISLLCTRSVHFGVTLLCTLFVLPHTLSAHVAPLAHVAAGYLLGVAAFLFCVFLGVAAFVFCVLHASTYSLLLLVVVVVLVLLVVACRDQWKQRKRRLSQSQWKWKRVQAAIAALGMPFYRIYVPPGPPGWFGPETFRDATASSLQDSRRHPNFELFVPDVVSMSGRLAGVVSDYVDAGSRLCSAKLQDFDAMHAAHGAASRVLVAVLDDLALRPWTDAMVGFDVQSLQDLVQHLALNACPEVRKSATNLFLRWVTLHWETPPLPPPGKPPDVPPPPSPPSVGRKRKGRPRAAKANALAAKANALGFANVPVLKSGKKTRPHSKQVQRELPQVGDR
jgi:hypothetical protein